MDPILLDAPAGLVGPLREGLLDEGITTLDRAFLRWNMDTMPVHVIALGFWIAEAARSHGLAVADPTDVLVNVNAWLQRHVDKTAPYPSLNGLVVLRDGATGGALTFDDGEIPMPDRQIVIFDGLTPHSVTPIEREPGGYRCSLLYYLGLEP